MKLIGSRNSILFLCSIINGFLFADCFPDHVDSTDITYLNSASIFLDQDMFVKTDRDYTMGLQVSLGGPWVYKAPVYCQMTKGLHFFNSLAGDYRNDGYPLYFQSGSIGDTAFTPRDIGSTDPIFNDRPYANMFYVSVGEVMVEELDEYATKATSSKLILGVFGLNIGRDVQTWIHENVSGSTIPEGWEYQISDGGEPTGLYYRNHMRNYPTEKEISWVNPEFLTYWDYSLGYYVEGGVGGLMRLGSVNSPFYEHLSNPISIGNHFAAPGDFYVFLDVSAKMNLYNAMLQGQFAQSTVTYDFDELNHFIYQYSGGGVVGLGEHLAFSYVYHHRSPQLQEGPGSRPHKFTGLYLSYSWSF